MLEAMKTIVLLFTLILLHLPSSKLQFQPDTTLPQDETSQARLLQVFEQALLNDSQNLYNIRKVFFNPNGKQPNKVNISVVTTVGYIKNWDPDSDPSYVNCNMNKKVDYILAGTGFIYCNQSYDHSDWYTLCKSSPCKKCWVRTNIPNSTDLLTWADVDYKLGTISDLVLNEKVWNTLASIDYLALVLLSNIGVPSLDNFAYRNVYYEQPPQMKISLNIPQLDFMPCDEDVVETMRVLFVWVKAYARHGGRTYERSESDRGLTMTENSYWNYENSEAVYGGYSEGVICNIIISIYLTVNFLTVLLAYFFLEKVVCYFLSNPDDSMVRHLYLSLSILVSLFNVTTFVSNMASTAGLGIVYRRILYIDIILIIFYLLVEPLISWNAAKSIRFELVHDLVLHYTLINVFPFLCCISCCILLALATFMSRWKHRIFHSACLLQILWFVHRLESSTIVAVIMVLNNPPKMITSITLLISIFLCIVLMIYTCFRTNIYSEKCRCCKICIHVLFTIIFGIGIIVFLVLVTVMYLAFLEYGLNYSTVGGVILSGIPPTTIFVLTLYFKKRFTNRDSTSAVNDTLPTQQTPNHRNCSINADETTSLVRN